MKADLTGKRFGRLMVLEPGVRNRWRQELWRCKCDCGEVRNIPAFQLRAGQLSCGCWGQGDAHRTHGLNKRNGKRTAEYISWRTIHRNCTRPNAVRYQYFGGKGIKNLFESFAQFIAHVGPRPSTDHFLKRLDTDEHYMPGNIEWRLIKRKPRAVQALAA